METAKREMTFLLAEPERRLLRWIAARLPRWMLPDHLTVLGVGGALLVGAGYALTGTHPGTGTTSTTWWMPSIRP
jgi:archaetidylinositol phosphate synthase